MPAEPVDAPTPRDGGGAADGAPTGASAPGDTAAGPPVVALVPAYQEGPRVADVVHGAAINLPVLVVDDGSGDDTAERAETAGATVLRQRPNQGKGAAIRAGFRWALEHRVEAVVILDGDGQHDPAELPRFLHAFAERRGDLIIGRRDFRRMPPVRRLSNTVGGWAFSWAVGRSIPDNQSGYRLVSRRLMERLVDGHETGFEFDVEMITTCIRADFRLDWVPIRTIYAGEPSHVRPLTHVRGFTRVVRKARRDVRAPRP
jgi:glycosyltransferase involved in cell wall biosynthesis